jgi:hypothetical protein
MRRGVAPRSITLGDSRAGSQDGQSLVKSLPACTMMPTCPEGTPDLTDGGVGMSSESIPFPGSAGAAAVVPAWSEDPLTARARAVWTAGDFFPIAAASRPALRSSSPGSSSSLASRSSTWRAGPATSPFQPRGRVLG